MDQRLEDALAANERLRAVVRTLRYRVKHSHDCNMMQTWWDEKTLPCSCGLRAIIDEAKEALNEQG
jgi:hypothetical protein